MSSQGTDRRRLRNDLKELAKLAGELQPQPPPSSHAAIAATSLVDDVEELHEMETEVLTPATMKHPPSARFSVPPVSVPAVAPSMPPQPYAVSVAPPSAPRSSRGVGRAIAIGATAGLLISAIGIGGMVMMKRGGQAASNEPSGASAIQVAPQPAAGGDDTATAAKAQPGSNTSTAKTGAAPKDDAFSIDDLPQAKKATAPAWYRGRGYAAPKPPAAVAAPVKPAAPEPPAAAPADDEPAAEEKVAAPEPKPAKAEPKVEAKVEAKAAPEPAKSAEKPAETKAPAAGADTPSSNPLLDEIRAAVKKEQSGKK